MPTARQSLPGDLFRSRAFFNGLFIAAIVVATVLVVRLFPQPHSTAYAYPTGGSGYDVSFPQCGAALPETGDFGVVGATGGRAFTENPCISSEFQWAESASRAPTFYMNLNFPSGSTASEGVTGPAGTCGPADLRCGAYNYGWNAASFAFAWAKQNNASASLWWLDIETVNSWSPDVSLNDAVLEGAVDAIEAHDATAGVYST